MKRALILAAGKGQRLGKLTANIPKCLLPINSKDTILDFTLKALKKLDIPEVVIVTGFAKEKLEEHLKQHWKNTFQFEFIHNKSYDQYNNIYSAYLAKDNWTDETILFNSDIIFDPKILELLVTKIKDSGQPAQNRRGSLNSAERQTSDNKSQLPTLNPQSYLVIDDHEKLTEEDMKVTINENKEIRRIHKSLDINTSYGEYIGITYLRGKTRLKFIQSLENNVKQNNFDLYYEDALDHIAGDILVLPCSTQGNLWTEVDTKEDYELAKKIAIKISSAYESDKHTNQTSHASLKQ